MLHTLLHAFSHAFEDVIKNVPILLVVYALLYWLENRMRTAPALLERAQSVGPVIGAAAGLIPQCGFSAAASALFVEGFLAPATLVSVFLATSDEALPLLLSSGRGRDAVILLVAKFLFAVAGGYFLQWTFFRRRQTHHKPVQIDIHHDCSCCGSSIFSGVIWRTVKTCLFLMLIVFVMELLVEGIGEERLASFLLGGSLFQPVLCALIGLVPSCAISVLLTELYLSGAIGLGGLIAGLSTGAGFGYMILLRSRAGRRRALPVIGATLILAIVFGMGMELLL